jgi:hypothetical protein
MREKPAMKDSTFWVGMESQRTGDDAGVFGEWK